MYNSGTGDAQLEKLFACINLPFLSKSNLRRCEAEAGQAIEAVAKKSCQLAIDEENKENIGCVKWHKNQRKILAYIILSCNYSDTMKYDNNVTHEQSVCYRYDYDTQ